MSFWRRDRRRSCSRSAVSSRKAAAIIIALAWRRASSVGLRAVVLAHGDDVARLREGAPADAFVAAYVPHAELFSARLSRRPSRGVGTSAQALRAGKPQLVTPFLADQPDNAARLVRLGLARAFDGGRSRRKSSRGAADFAEDAGLRHRARESAGVIASEDGAAVAASKNRQGN